MGKEREDLELADKTESQEESLQSASREGVAGIDLLNQADREKLEMQKRENRSFVTQEGLPSAASLLDIAPAQDTQRRDKRAVEFAVVSGGADNQSDFLGGGAGGDDVVGQEDEGDRTIVRLESGARHEIYQDGSQVYFDEKGRPQLVSCADGSSFEAVYGADGKVVKFFHTQIADDGKRHVTMWTQDADGMWVDGSGTGRREFIRIDNRGNVSIGPDRETEAGGYVRTRSGKELAGGAGSGQVHETWLDEGKRFELASDGTKRLYLESPAHKAGWVIEEYTDGLRKVFNEKKQVVELEYESGKGYRFSYDVGGKISQYWQFQRSGDADNVLVSWKRNEGEGKWESGDWYLKRSGEVRVLGSDVIEPRDDLVKLDGLPDKWRALHARLDSDRDGVLSAAEVDAGIGDHGIRGSDAIALALMRRAFDTLKKLGGDEDGLTIKDIDAIDALDEGDKTLDQLQQWLNLNNEAIRSATTHQLFARGLDSIKPEAAVQGQIRDCYVIASIAALAGASPEKIKDMIEESEPDEKGVRTFTVKFPGRDPIKVPEPTETELALCANGSSHGIWVPVLEKAIGMERAKGTGIAPSRINDAGSSANEGLAILTGKDSLDIDWNSFLGFDAGADGVHAKLVDCIKNGRPVTAYIGLRLDGKATTPDLGLATKHDYAVIGYDEKTRMVTIFNPMVKEPEATSKYNVDFGKDEGDGIFALKLEDFIASFDGIVYS